MPIDIRGNSEREPQLTFSPVAGTQSAANQSLSRMWAAWQTVFKL